MHDLLAKILASRPFSDLEKELILEAFDFAKNAHNSQKRLSGEDYIMHPLKVALMISEQGFDSRTIAASILHDTLEDTATSYDQLKEKFGQDVAFLVDGVTKLSNIEYAVVPHSKINKTELDKYLYSLKRMFLAMAKDVRVIFIKLADRYHNMQTLEHLPEDSRQRIALETIEIYAPIAGRLGMGKIKGQLEDLAFPHVYPQEYLWLTKNIKDKYEDRLKYIAKISPIIHKHLNTAGIKVIDLHSRAKHQYSLYQKLKKRAMDPEKIFDLVAVRILLPDISSCYEALGVIHEHYKPLPGHIKDFIALPKPNGYQSLHTTIFCELGKIVEVQIRTPAMHDYAENGIAAHWAYSEQGKKTNTRANTKETEWIVQLKEFIKDAYLKEDLSQLKTDFFGNRIFAFTPRGEVKDLPEGATPIDFAYAVHSELGHSIQGAKINGKMVPLDHELQSGDVVEVIKRKNGKPSFDWLKTVKTSEAKKKIRSWFNRFESKTEEKNDLPDHSKKQVKRKVLIKINPGEPIIQGQQGLMYKLARCCKPDMDDQISGYMTINKGVTIHAKDCPNIRSSNGTRILSATWAKKI